MELFIIAALSTDGFIARSKDEPAMWTSKEDKQRFVALTKDAGVVIMGSTTFKTLPKPLKGRLNIVYSRSLTLADLEQAPAEEDREVEITQATPSELLTDLSAQGYTKVAVCGGSEIYSLFMESGLVSKLYLTVEPILFGQGISMFKNQFSESKNLKLIKQSTTESGTLFLDYEVVV